MQTSAKCAKSLIGVFVGACSYLWAPVALAQCPAWGPPFVPAGGDLTVNTQLLVYDGKLVVNSYSQTVNGETTSGYAQFDGSVFTPMFNGWTNPGASRATVFQGKLYATGSPANAAGLVWTGSTWVPWTRNGMFQNGLGTVTNSYNVGTHLLAQGRFAFGQVGELPVITQNAVFDGTTWYPASTQWGPNLPYGVSSITDVQEWDGQFYVGGGFAAICKGTSYNQAPVVPSRGICIYTGTAWLEMPNGGLNGPVTDLIIYNDQLYVCGEFSATGDGTIALNRIARFDGAWHPVGSGMPSSLNPKAMCVGDDGTGETLFVAVNGAVLRWNGSAFTFLGNILGNASYALAAYESLIGPGIYLSGQGLRRNFNEDGLGMMRWGPTTGSLADSDGDGLLDAWEENGVDGDCNGTIDLNLAALGANKFRKDIFVEVDSMVGRTPLAGTLDRVVGAFALAPVTNPNGVDGIDLRLIVDAADQSIPLQDFPNDWWDFHAIKSQRFGNAADRASPNKKAILDAKRKVFRYCIFGNTYGGSDSSGLGELPGNDFIVTLGNFRTPGGTPDQQAATFMHEMGHTLGLYHGGHQIDWANDRRFNYKPNYHSIMNYSWQLASRRSGWALDYSREPLPALNENALDEVLGIGGMLSAVALVGPLPVSEELEQGSIDFDRDGVIDTGLVAADVNFLYGVDAPSPGDVLQGSEDWSRLKYNFRTTRGYASGDSPESSLDMDEMNVELAEYIDGLYTGGCHADFDGDGFLTFEDFDGFVTAFEAGGSSADFDGDGFLTFEDFDAFVAAFEAGC